MHNIRAKTHAQNDEMNKKEYFSLTRKYFFIYNKHIDLFKEGR